MTKLINKELRLSTSPITFIFLVFSLMVFIPGYPILMSAFFICLGIFQSFHQTRATNDILYTALLPIRKKDVVRSKYTMVCFIQGVGFVLMAIFTVLRMTRLKDSIVYRENFMMNANLVFLGFVLLMFVAFNLVFVNGFFKSADKINKPYLLFILIAIILLIIAEVLHFIPSIQFLNYNLGEGGIVSASSAAVAQIIFFVVCLAIYVLGTMLALRSSQKRLDALDL